MVLLFVVVGLDLRYIFSRHSIPFFANCMDVCSLIAGNN